MEVSHSRSIILGKTSKRISYERALIKNYRLIDVRSAAEFNDGTIPGAVNVPLFDESERSVIGTIYNHGGREKAMDQGFAFADKKLQELLDAFIPFKEQTLAIFCARGGMRSLSVVNLLNQSGYEVYQIEGGYKKYRHEVLDKLSHFQPRLIVLHGLTGSGKTRIIKKLANSIDLEELAQHRSSLFGGLDRAPSNQRSFESLMVQTITSLGSEPYFIEGESRKIGRVFIPKPLASSMKEGILVKINCSLETRIRRIVEDYPIEGSKKQEQIVEILESLKQKMGKAKVEEMCELLKTGELHALVRILLKDYYDKRYLRSMSNYQYDLEISSESIQTAATELENYRSKIMAR